jgi:hypothetical protein
VVAVARRFSTCSSTSFANRDRVVSKDDLISAIWEGRIVSDAALTLASTLPVAPSATAARSSRKAGHMGTTDQHGETSQKALANGIARDGHGIDAASVGPGPDCCLLLASSPLAVT